jgi:hypothetical protein
MTIIEPGKYTLNRSQTPPPTACGRQCAKPYAKEETATCYIYMYSGERMVAKEAHLDAYKPPEAVQMLTEMLLLLVHRPPLVD